MTKLLLNIIKVNHALSSSSVVPITQNKTAVVLLSTINQPIGSLHIELGSGFDKFELKEESIGPGQSIFGGGLNVHWWWNCCHTTISTNLVTLVHRKTSMHIYVDSDHAGDSITRRSCTGFYTTNFS